MKEAKSIESSALQSTSNWTVELHTPILEEPGSNLERDSEYSKVFRNVPQSLYANSGIVSRLDHNRNLPNLLQFIIHQSFYNSTLYRSDTDN